MNLPLPQIKRPLIIAIGILVASAGLLSGMLVQNTSAYDATDLEILTSCTSEKSVSLTGSLSIPTDAYSVYVQLAKRGQTALVEAYAETSSDGLCATVGAVEANGNGWTKVGSLSLNQDQYVTFQLSSDELGTALDANRPSILIVSESSPTCVPNPDCEVSIDGRLGKVLPITGVVSTNALHVSRVVPPELDTLKKVTYYVDDRQVYVSPEYAPIDERYVTYVGQKLNSVLEYESGQRVIFVEQVPAGYSDTFSNFIFRTFYKNPPLFIFFVALGVTAVLILFVWAITRAIRMRHLYRLNHGLARSKPERPLTGAQIENRYTWSRVWVWARRGLIGVGAAIGFFTVIAGTNEYIATVFRVDGESMQATYQDGQYLFINKVPITSAQIAGRDYIPKRGQAIIMKAVYGLTDPTYSDGSEYIIKRVLGLPGERVVVKDGLITIYKADGTAINPDENASWSDTMQHDDTKEFIELTLSENELFVSGDNRPGSIDSRFNGPILIDQVVGTVPFSN